MLFGRRLSGGYYYPICDIEICKNSCFQYLGYYNDDGASCFNGECYCKEISKPAPDKNTEEKKEVKNWSYADQKGSYSDSV